MAGRTGKLTAEALAARGPCFVLARDSKGTLFIYSEDAKLAFATVIIAKSFSLSYLNRLKKVNEALS